MDEKFRKRQRNYKASPNDAEAAAEYIRALEQQLGIEPETKHRVKVMDTTIPCLLCEKPISKCYDEERGWVYGDTYIAMNNPLRAVAISTDGNYGSQVLDGDVLYFVICDACIVKHSHKMFHTPESRNRQEIVNGRDYFEGWFKMLKEAPHHQDSNDPYMLDIRPYFEEPS